MYRSARSLSSSFWHSRLKLTAAIALISLCIAALNIRSNSIDLSQIPVIRTRDLIDDVQAALEDMKYLHDLQNGKAYIRPVVEEESPVNEYKWFCPLDPPKVFYPSGKWMPNANLSVYSAYYDGRINSLYPYTHALQILAMSYESIENVTTIYCNLYFPNSDSHTIVEGYIREIWQRGWDPRDDFYIPNLITCPIPRRFQNAKSISVSLSYEPCKNVANSMQVAIPENIADVQKKTLAVCVKGMDFQHDISHKLVQWLEILKLFQVDIVTFYLYSVTEGTKKIMDFYQKQGFVKLVPIDLPDNSPNIPTVRSSYIKRNRQQKRRHELIPYNDCFYRHFSTHRYVLILDIDEIIIPLQHDNYEQLLDHLEKEYKDRVPSSFSVRNVFKFPDNSTDINSSGFEFLTNKKRSKHIQAAGSYAKSFSSSSTLATVFNHFGLHRLHHKVSKTIHIDENLALKLHLKEDCPVESRNECSKLKEETVADHSLDRFRDQLEKKIRQIYINNGLL